MMLLTRINNNKTIDILLDDNMKEWKQVLKRLIDVAMSMAVCNIPFRGHSENVHDKNNQNQGNFLPLSKFWHDMIRF